MNVLDSELVVGSLRRHGYALTAHKRDADVALFNTCSIREHAEEKTYSGLGAMKRWKAARPGRVLGVLGCMAQKDREGVLARAPHVDLVAGPGSLAGLPEMIEEIVRSGATQLSFSLGRQEAGRREVEASFPSFDPDRDPEMRATPFQAYVRTQYGCDKFCSYCIVPSVRGPEQGRDPASILGEIRQLAAQGVKEVDLIGQTVNSYRFTYGDGRRMRLSDLLAAACDVPGIERVKFATSFPNDMSDDLLAAVRDLPKVAKHLHVPAQSGCDEVLARMKRHYSVASYREMVLRAREAVPGIAITSDFITGFCGETEESFERTCELVRFAGFKNSYIFAYSTRPGTAAHALPDDVPDAVKKRRTNDLIAVQQEVSFADHRRMIGREVVVLVEGPSRLGRHDAARGEPVVQMSGRAATDHIVVFDGAPSLAGSMLKLRVEDASALTLFASLDGGGNRATPPGTRPGAAPRPALPVLG